MLSKIKSCGLIGIDGYIVEVEADISGRMPGFEIADMRDILIHDCFGIDLKLTWETVQKDIIKLEENIKYIIDDYI